MYRKKYKAEILIVDDIPQNLRLLAKILSKQGYLVRLAPNGKRALAIVEDNIPDLILLDIMMPEMDGYEVCQLLKANEAVCDVPVIFLSALDKIMDKVKAFEMGGVDYITKPLEEKEILARVQTHLTIRNLQKELEARNRELARLVNIDGLTQVASRRYFDSYLEQEWKRLAREKNHLALIMLDLDYFKLYNDYYGHPIGDDCLKQIGQTLMQAIQRPADLAARYGGEEFVMVLPNIDKSGAVHVAKNIQEKLHDLQIPHTKSNVSPYVTCSMGIACMIPNQSLSLAEFITIADKALYTAKEQGRNQFILGEY